MQSTLVLLLRLSLSLELGQSAVLQLSLPLKHRQAVKLLLEHILALALVEPLSLAPPVPRLTV